MAHKSIKSALICTSLLKKDYFIASFPGKVIFGEIENYNFFENKYFEIYRFSFCKFYETILAIIEHIVNPKASKGMPTIFVEKKYIYEASADYVELRIEEKDGIVYKAQFNLSEINNLMDCFKELMLTSLLLNPSQSQIFRDLSLLEITKLRDFEDERALIKYLNRLYPNDFTCFALVSLNFDLIILLHKLFKLVSCDYRKSSYLSLLTN